MTFKRSFMLRDYHRSSGALLRALGALLVVSVVADAQQPDPPPAAPQAGELLQTRRWFQGGNADRDAPLLIETSPPIANLLTRAEDGIARRDWKLVIDSLQRVIDDRTGTLVPRDDGTMEGGLLFESAGRLAMRRLASLPPEGLLAYRILFDGKAKGLFERAKAENDSAALRAVADRFLLTRYGDNAADLLASRALDDGRLTEAVALLNDLQNLVPDNDIPPDRVYGKLAVAYALMGFPARASEIVNEYRSRFGGKTEPPPEISDLKSQIPDIKPQSPDVKPEISDRKPGVSDFKFEISKLDAWVRRTHDLMVSKRASDVGGQASARVGPQVFPSLMEQVPWRYDLEGVAADLWRRITNDDPGIPPPIPQNDIIADGDRLYVRIPGGCAALDIDDLTAVWRSPADAAFRPVIQQTFTSRGPAMTIAAPVGPYSDDPANSLSTALGLVFAIEKFGAGEFADRDEVAGQRLLFIRQPMRNMRGVTNGTRLVAYDGRTGAVRWQRGRTDISQDLLGDVRFLSAPIAVGDAIWVPYLQGTDVYVGVLRPADGAVLRTILLGSVREPPDAHGGAGNVHSAALSTPTTRPTLSDGVVYIPTGFGALYAVDADRMSLRWAALYDTQRNAARRLPATAPKYWLPSPPVVSGGLVLLAPTDFAEVMAFDAATGEYRWSDIAEGCSYLIAADQGRVWLGGRRITCRQLVDGQLLWTTHLLGLPTGKAVVCGQVVHIPTSDGLISLDALDGTIRGQQAVPASQPPLGNLACMNTGLYSLDPSSIRKFPDIERMHEAAMALLSADPKNVTAAVQLAWAELLRGQPQHAYDAVVGLHEDARKRFAVARVTVEALLTLAGQAPSPDEAMRLLQKADESAVSAASRLRCRSAMADQLATLGRNLDAYRGLLAVGLSPDADEVIELDDGVTSVARLDITRRLHQLHARLTADELRTVEAQTARRIETLAKQLREERDSRSARDELLALADLHFPSVMGVRALYELADWEIDQRLFERAEQRLLKCTRSDADPMWTAAAYVRLCELYAESEVDAVGLLVQSLDELNARFGSAPLPVGSGRRVGNTYPRALRSSERIGDWVAKMRSRIPTEKLPTALPAMYGEIPPHGPAFSLAGRYAWTYDPPDEADPARFVLFQKVPPRAMIDRIVVLGRDGFLECISADRKELLWRTRLSLPGAFADIPPDFGQQIPNTARWGVAEGQTVVLSGPEGLFAVGLLTGRLLWVRPFDRSVLDAAGAAARDPLTAVRDGLLAAMPRDGRLALMRVADGSTIWERDLRGESVARIWLHENSVVFADDAMKRVHVLDRESGRLIQQILLRQPDPDHERIDLVQAGGMLYGPDSTGPGDGVAAFDLQSGERRWRVDLDKPVVALFEPAAGYLGIGLLNGDLRIVSAATGEVVLERSDPTVRAVIGGVMWDGTLILRCAGGGGQGRETWGRGTGQRQGNELAAFDIATGAEVWRRRDATALLPGDVPLSIIGGVIPAIVERPRAGGSIVEAGGVATPRGGSAITLIDARTGADSGTPVDLNAVIQGATLNGDMGFWPNVLVIGTIKGIHAVRVETAEPATGRDF